MPIIMNGRNIFKSNSTIQQNSHHFAYNSRCYLVFSLVDLTAKVATICFYDRIPKLELEKTTDTSGPTSSLVISDFFFNIFLQSYQDTDQIQPLLGVHLNFKITLILKVNHPPNKQYYALIHFNSFTPNNMKSECAVIIKTYSSKCFYFIIYITTK